MVEEGLHIKHVSGVRCQVRYSDTSGRVVRRGVRCVVKLVCGVVFQSWQKGVTHVESFNFVANEIAASAGGRRR